MIWFARRFGLRELIGKPLRELFAPRRARADFMFDGMRHRYVDHPYNWTWLNERCVEIPLARYELRDTKPEYVLEVGNVLAHYQNVWHRVIDKHEGAERMDVVHLKDVCRYERIISISTFEHIGFDERPPDPDKVRLAIEVCRRALTPDGVLFMTVPTDYNPALDALIEQYRPSHMRRIGRSAWEEGRNDLARYGWPWPYANELSVVKIQGGAR